MRLIHYINEGSKKEIELPERWAGGEINPEDKIIELIKADCKPYLKQRGGGLLYRGMDSFADMLKIKPRKLRKPKDMPLYAHKALDYFFNKKFGWKVRSQGVFCSARYNQAIIYGHGYSIWPIGKFDFVWSKDIKDLYLTVVDVKNQILKDHNKTTALESLTQEDVIKRTKPKLKQIVNTYKKTNLAGAIDGQYGEIVLNCNSYYAVNHQHLLYFADKL